jgi:hypothetical protein
MEQPKDRDHTQSSSKRMGAQARSGKVFWKTNEAFMEYMLCRNRVRDLSHWRAIFDSHRSAQERAGLHLRNMWTSATDSNDVFFLFEIDSLKKAKEFINDLESAKAGETSGVLDGEYHFIQDLPPDE